MGTRKGWRVGHGGSELNDGDPMLWFERKSRWDEDPSPRLLRTGGKLKGRIDNTQKL